MSTAAPTEADPEGSSAGSPAGEPSTEPAADAPGGGLQRTLSHRHLQMIAIGGAIGTGLFVASGASVSGAGPGGALVAYLAIGAMVLLLMQSLGEMSAHLGPAPSRPTRRGT